MAAEQQSPVEHAVLKPESSGNEQKDTGRGRALARHILTKFKTLGAKGALRDLAGRLITGLQKKGDTVGKDQDLGSRPDTSGIARAYGLDLKVDTSGQEVVRSNFKPKTDTQPDSNAHVDNSGVARAYGLDLKVDTSGQEVVRSNFKPKTDK